MKRDGNPKGSKEQAALAIPGEPDFLVIGKIFRPHGIRGEMRMEVLTDFPERLQKGMTIYFGENHSPQVLRSLRWHRDALIMAIEAINDPESAGGLRNQLVYVRSDDRPPLPEGEYYHHQILGLKVKTIDDRFLGVLVQILETGANDVFIIRQEQGSEILIPAIPDVICKIDLQEGEIIVNLLPGLLPE